MESCHTMFAMFVSRMAQNKRRIERSAPRSAPLDGKEKHGKAVVVVSRFTNVIHINGAHQNSSNLCSACFEDGRSTSYPFVDQNGATTTTLLSHSDCLSAGDPTYQLTIQLPADVGPIHQCPSDFATPMFHGAQERCDSDHESFHRVFWTCNLAAEQQSRLRSSGATGRRRAAPDTATTTRPGTPEQMAGGVWCDQMYPV